MKKLITICLVATTALVMNGAANADWNPGDPYKMHYPQLPDLATGMDVLDGPGYSGIGSVHDKMLADDFLCTQTGPITDIHIWSSYLNNVMPPIVPDKFNIGIYSNIPAGAGGITYSRPGQLLWSGYLEATERLYANTSEYFYNPSINQIIGYDNLVYQYNFTIAPQDAFVQQAGTTYWLAIHHTDDLNRNGYVDSGDVSIAYYPFAFGWKSSLAHWNDDAVWVDTPLIANGMPPQSFSYPTGGWNELRYPLQGSPFGGQSMDLAFVITPEPATICLLGLGVLSLIRRKK